MTQVHTRLDDGALDRALQAATPPPDMPVAAIHAHAMAAFVAQTQTARPPLFKRAPAQWAALAATLVVGLGGFMALQSHSANQQAIATDADAFAEQLLSETF
ncbi:MAG: hypothetical protein RLZZ157_903 [Pseudomonadota bacterium]|jgi:hypothetical protein